MSEQATQPQGGPKIIKLSKPIKAHREELHELELREPTPDDMFEEGIPFLVIQSESEAAGVEVRPKVVGRYIMRLARIPLSSVTQLTLADFFKCQTAVMGFFGHGGDSQTQESSEKTGADA